MAPGLFASPAVRVREVRWKGLDTGVEAIYGDKRAQMPRTGLPEPMNLPLQLMRNLDSLPQRAGQTCLPHLSGEICQ